MIRDITYLVWDVVGEMVSSVNVEGSGSVYTKINVGLGS